MLFEVIIDALANKKTYYRYCNIVLKTEVGKMKAFSAKKER